MHNRSGGKPASEDEALRRQSALSILENAIVFCTDDAQILPNGKGPFLFVINNLVPVLRDHGKLGLLDTLASQIFDHPNDPNSGELRHSTAICSGYVPADQVLRTVLSISRAFGLEEAMNRLSGPEGEGLVSICTTLSFFASLSSFVARLWYLTISFSCIYYKITAQDLCASSRSGGKRGLCGNRPSSF